MAKTLIEATTADELNLDSYRDLYNERLTKLIEMKVAGQEVVEAPPSDGPSVINLMDALKASVERTKAKAPAASFPQSPRQEDARCRPQTGAGQEKEDRLGTLHGTRR